MENNFFHLFANGKDSQDFLVSTRDYYAAFNRVGICAYLSNAEVLAFSIEDTHPHFLIRGSVNECNAFKEFYEKSTIQYIAATRGSIGGSKITLTSYEVKEKEYLMNVAAYVITQPTKDGKKIMPYDYLWGTASLYFRPATHIPIWKIKDGKISETARLSDMTIRSRREILRSRRDLPGEWIICNGFLLPENYVNVRMYENIFLTHNCFRAFLSSGKRNDEQIMTRMSRTRGVIIDDFEARQLFEKYASREFGTADTRHLTVNERISLSLKLRGDCGLSIRQISKFVHIPIKELEPYIK